RTILELFELALALGIADLLEDDLLCALRIDAAEVDRRQRINDEIAHACAGLELLGLLDIDLLEVVLDLLDDLDHAPQPQVTGERVKLGADVVFGAIAAAGALLDRLFHRLDDDRLVDHLLGCNGVCNRKQFSLVGGYRTGHQSSAFSSSVSSISSTPLVSSGRVAAISLSVRTSLAERMFVSGISMRPALRSAIATVSPSIPSSSPRSLRWSPTGSPSETFTSCPAQAA